MIFIFSAPLWSCEPGPGAPRLHSVTSSAIYIPAAELRGMEALARGYLRHQETHPWTAPEWLDTI